MYNKKMQYVIKTCPSENIQELQNLLNEMSMNNWELYSMQEIESDDGILCHCIFMQETQININGNADEINISSFKSRMEKMLSNKQSPYDICLEIQSKIRDQKEKISKIKSELEGEAPASVNRKKLNDKISAGLKQLEELKNSLAKATSPDEMFAKLQVENLSIHLSEEILNNGQDMFEEELVAETVKLRIKLAENLGYIIPKIIFKDDEDLNPYEFSINIHGFEAFKANIYPGYVMYFEDELHFDKKIKDSIQDIDKITGRKIIWIEKDITKDFWNKGLSCCEYITKALEFTAVKFVDDLLSYEDVEKYINIINNKFLVENLIPDYISIPDIRYILTNLIKEKVSIKDITYIFEKLNDFAEESSKSDLLKKLRLSLSRQICKSNMNSDGIISLIEISEKTLEKFMPEEGDDAIIRINGDFAETLAEKIRKQIKQLDIKNPKLLVPLELRYLIFTLLNNYLSDITVLALEEIGCNADIEIIAEI